MLRLTILFDNYVNPRYADLGLKQMWGFSVYIEYSGKKILFDTGSNGRVLKHNAEKLGVDLSQVEWLFISHPHWDHIGGWDTVVEESRNMQMAVPASLSSHLIDDLKRYTKVRVIDQQPEHIEDFMFSTGIMFPEGEQGLVLETPAGIVLVVGCSHPRVENLIYRAKQILPHTPVFYVIGGFHLLYDAEDQIWHSIKSYDTQYITPTHCTGEKAVGLIRDYFGADRYIEGGVGQRIEFNI